MAPVARVAVEKTTCRFDKLFDYAIPQGMPLRPGVRVLVPFGHGRRIGLVVELAEQAAHAALKPIAAPLEEEPVLTEEGLFLLRWLRENTFCTWFEAVKAVIPYGAQYRPAVVDGRHVMQGRLTRSTERLYTLAGDLPEKPKPGPRQLAAVAALQNGPLTARQLDEVGISRATLDGLVKKGVLTAAEQEYIVGMLLFWMQREMTSPLPGSRR